MKIKGLDLSKILGVLGKHRYVIILTVTVLLFVIALYRINVFASVERNEDVYNEKVLTIDKVEFDQDSIQRIIDLNDLNIDIQSDFEAGRNNPFSN